MIRYRHDADSHPMDVFATDWHKLWRAQYLEYLTEVGRPFLQEYNTAQLDAIYLQKLCAAYGLTVSTMEPFGLMLLPLMTLPALEVSMAMKPTLKYGGRFQRRVIHYLSPKLARYPTIRGCPAAPLQFSNCHLFLPRVPAELKRVLRKLGNVWFRKSWFPVYSEPAPTENPFGPVIEREMAPGGCLHYASMTTAGLYRAPVLASLLERHHLPGFGGNRVLSWIYTIEAMSRRTGAVCRIE
jgi:hypothetical protein